MKFALRAAAESDLEQLTEIYNHYVRTTTITFDLEPFTVAQRREWFAHYAPTGPHRIWVAVDGERVLGYAWSSRLRPKDAYLTSVETSIYCRPETTGKGVGRELYRRVFADLQREDLHRAYACITLPNDGSVAFHRAFGFVECGKFTEVGRKFGKLWDVLWMEKKLGE